MARRLRSLLPAVAIGLVLAPPALAGEDGGGVSPGPASALAPGTTFRDCPECPEMTVLPAGRFVMGWDGDPPEQNPPTEVTVARPFAIGRMEVTTGQYEACVRAGGCDPLGERFWFDERADRDRFPVTHTSYSDIRRYLSWLTGRTGHAYRLPSEAEWEYAAAGGTDGLRWFGDRPIPDGQVNCYDCPGDPWRGVAPVAQFPPNPYGLYDMLGNVSEFVADCWRDSHAGRPETAAVFSPCMTRFQVLRGGKWSSKAKAVHRYFRFYYPRKGSRNDLGFRVARDIVPAAD